MISKRTFRGTPTETIFSYLLEILENIGVKVVRRKRQTANNRFIGVIEGMKAQNPSICIQVKIEGEEEPWSQVGGRFLPTIHTSHVTAETYKITPEEHEDSEGSVELLQQFNSKISKHVWHTAG